MNGEVNLEFSTYWEVRKMLSVLAENEKACLEFSIEKLDFLGLEGYALRIKNMDSAHSFVELGDMLDRYEDM